jgi:hypothetical protein
MIAFEEDRSLHSVLEIFMDVLNEFCKNEAQSFHRDRNSLARQCLAELFEHILTKKFLNKEANAICRLLRMDVALQEQQILFQCDISQKKIQSLVLFSWEEKKNFLTEHIEKYQQWKTLQRQNLQKNWAQINRILTTENFSDTQEDESMALSRMSLSERANFDQGALAYNLREEYEDLYTTLREQDLQIENTMQAHEQFLIKFQKDLITLDLWEKSLKSLQEYRPWTLESFAEKSAKLEALEHNFSDIRRRLNEKVVIGPKLDLCIQTLVNQQVLTKNQWETAKSHPDELKMILGGYMETLYSWVPTQMQTVFFSPVFIQSCAQVGSVVITQAILEKFETMVQNPPEDQSFWADLSLACDTLVRFFPKETYPSFNAELIMNRLWRHAAIPMSSTPYTSSIGPCAERGFRTRLLNAVNHAKRIAHEENESFRPVNNLPVNPLIFSQHALVPTQSQNKNSSRNSDHDEKAYQEGKIFSSFLPPIHLKTAFGLSSQNTDENSLDSVDKFSNRGKKAKNRVT